MTRRLAIAALSLLPLPSFAQTSAPLAAATQFIIPEFDAARAAFSQTGSMDLENAKGDMDVARFEIGSLLSRPISPAEGIYILPLFEYELTSLNFDGTPAAFPIHDEDLHSLSLSTYVVSMRKGSPWIFGGWARAELASDFQHINGDDFTFDLAAGAGYRVNDHFTVAIGAALINLNGDDAFIPGINFDWVVSDQFRVGIYGPTFVAAYTPSTQWAFSFRGDPGGGIWNVTGDGGQSRSIDLTSYQLGLYASRHLTGDLWLTAGAGATVGNEIAYTRPNGGKLLELDADEALFGIISLRLKAW